MKINYDEGNIEFKNTDFSEFMSDLPAAKRAMREQIYNALTNAKDDDIGDENAVRSEELSYLYDAIKEKINTARDGGDASELATYLLAMRELHYIIDRSGWAGRLNRADNVNVINLAIDTRDKFREEISDELRDDNDQLLDWGEEKAVFDAEIAELTEDLVSSGFTIVKDSAAVTDFDALMEKRGSARRAIRASVYDELDEAKSSGVGMDSKISKAELEQVYKSIADRIDAAEASGNAAEQVAYLTAMRELHLIIEGSGTFSNLYMWDGIDQVDLGSRVHANFYNTSDYMTKKNGYNSAVKAINDRIDDIKANGVTPRQVNEQDARKNEAGPLHDDTEGTPEASTDATDATTSPTTLSSSKVQLNVPSFTKIFTNFKDNPTGAAVEALTAFINPGAAALIAAKSVIDVDAGTVDAQTVTTVAETAAKDPNIVLIGAIAELAQKGGYAGLENVDIGALDGTRDAGIERALISILGEDYDTTSTPDQLAAQMLDFAKSDNPLAVALVKGVGQDHESEAAVSFLAASEITVTGDDVEIGMAVANALNIGDNNTISAEEEPRVALVSTPAPVKPVELINASFEEAAQPVKTLSATFNEQAPGIVWRGRDRTEGIKRKSNGAADESRNWIKSQDAAGTSDAAIRFGSKGQIYVTLKDDGKWITRDVTDYVRENGIDSLGLSSLEVMPAAGKVDEAREITSGLNTLYELAVTNGHIKDGEPLVISGKTDFSDRRGNATLDFYVTKNDAGELDYRLASARETGANPSVATNRPVVDIKPRRVDEDFRDGDIELKAAVTNGSMPEAERAPDNTIVADLKVNNAPGASA